MYLLQPFTLPPGVHSNDTSATLAPAWNSRTSASNQPYQPQSHDQRKPRPSTKQSRSYRNNHQTRSSTRSSTKHLPVTTSRQHAVSTNETSSTRQSSRDKAVGTNQKAQHKPLSLFFVIVGLMLLGLSATGLALCRDFHLYILVVTAGLVSF